MHLSKFFYNLFNTRETDGGIDVLHKDEGLSFTLITRTHVRKLGRVMVRFVIPMPERGTARSPGLTGESV